MAMQVRHYRPEDYSQLSVLYKNGALYGGQFDPDRDSALRMQKRIEADPDSIFVVEKEGRIVGTLSLIEDGRTAWLFRFAVEEGRDAAQIEGLLYENAFQALKKKGHRQVLVYSPAGNSGLDARYERLGFTRGADYTCYWKEFEA